MIDKKVKKEEAVKRMSLMKLYKPVIEDFKDDKHLYYSDYLGILYWVEKEEILEKIQDFEQRFNAVVYHVIKTQTEFGLLYSFLYVSNYKEEWEMELEDIKKGQLLAYVYNSTDDILSEIGYIGIQPKNGGVVRVW